jgi:hypothetical protein
MEGTTMAVLKQPPPKWAPLAGKWSCSGAEAKYEEPTPGGQHPFGLALSSHRLHQGILKVAVRLEGERSSGRLVFGYDSSSGNYFSVGVGGDVAYMLYDFVAGSGWRALAMQGSSVNIPTKTDIPLQVDLRGQRIRLTVDSVTVIEQNLPHPLVGDQVGVFTWGSSPVAFSGFSTESSSPRAFVIMQYAEPFNSFFEKVIKPVAERAGLEAFRASDVYKPGMILEDIQRDILESEVIVAEITPGNPNVFYELGYAHALRKQTILLADQAIAELPFDIRGYRVIFYQNTIKGKPEVEEALAEHLKNIMKGF